MNDRSNEHSRYVMGFILAVVLTVIPFGVVWTGALTELRAGMVIAGCAIAQLAVHLRCFLHIGVDSKNREDFDLILFTTLLLLILVGGTIWILSDLHHRMH